MHLIQCLNLSLLGKMLENFKTDHMGKFFLRHVCNNPIPVGQDLDPIFGQRVHIRLISDKLFCSPSALLSKLN